MPTTSKSRNATAVGDLPSSETDDVAFAESAERPQAVADSTNSVGATAKSWGVSLLFWGSLLIAAGLYAAVALSPRLLAWKTLSRERYNHQVKLVTLEFQTRYLKRVIRAFETDPEFAAEQARIDFDANRPGETRIPVDPRWALDQQQVEPVFPQPKVSYSWYVIALDAIASSRHLQRSMLTAAVLITLLAFTFFQESQIAGLKALVKSIVDFWLRVTARYRTSAR